MSNGNRILDSIFVYVGSAFHFLMQWMNIAAAEGMVNIMVGLLVALYTLTKIVDWGLKHRRLRRKRLHNLMKQKRPKDYEEKESE